MEQARRNLAGPVAAVAFALVLIPAAAGAGLVWGDVHAHSGFSDDAAPGDAASFFQHARDDVGLDFVVLSDHDIWLTAEELARTQVSAAAFDDPGRFVAIPGVEWTRTQHLNAYFLRNDVGICGGGEGPPCDQITDFLAFYGPEVSAGRAAAHVNHPSWGIPWERIDDAILTNTEVWNTLWDGVYGKRPGVVHRDDPGFGGNLWALQVGLRLGFVGASDDHRQPYIFGGNLLGTALTACPVDSFDRAGILRALRERRCYATNGERIVVAFDVDGTTSGGEVAVPLHSSVTVTADVGGTDVPVIEVLRNGSVVASKSDCASPACRLSVPVPIDDEYSFVYVRVRQPNGRSAWTSPVWIRGECAAPGDCPLDRFVPGIGDPRTRCLVDWRVLPRMDRTASGGSVARVTCADGDPACDFGSGPGECTFRVSVCVGFPREGPSNCRPGPIDRYALLRPSASAAARDVIHARNRSTLLATVAGLTGRPLGSCGPYVDVTVPVVGLGPTRYRILGRASSAAGLDWDRLILVCRADGSLRAVGAGTGYRARWRPPATPLMADPAATSLLADD